MLLSVSVVSQFEISVPWVGSGPLVIVHTTNATRRSRPTSPCDVGLSYSAEPGSEVLQHGKARVCNEPVPGWLRRPHEDRAARSRARSSFSRVRARPRGLGVRSPHVRDHALLGRRFSRL